MATVRAPIHAQIWTATDGVRSASATFTDDGLGGLTIDLLNVSALQVANPSEVLTGVYFDIDGSPALVPLSVALFGASAFVPGADPDPPLGKHWAYADDANTVLATLPQYALLAAGLGVVGPPDAFSPAVGDDIDGMDYGLVGTAGYDTNHGGLSNGTPFIQNGVTFALSGMVAGATISNVRFQYGTSLTEPILDGEGGSGGSGIVPEPGTLSLLAAAGLGGLAPLVRRRLRK